MMEEAIVERVYVIQPVFGPEAKILHEEIVALIESAGASYAGTIYQNIREINPATFIGEGKLQELKERLEGLEVTVLFNGELSPSQTLNISAALENRKVIDRTTLILDIFALRAESSEGKLQVELAQYQYIYPRLKGKGAALSRLGGGIGTRGPGESQLETDRRHIRARIHALEQKLEETKKRRAMQVQRRKKDRVKTVALVGYTNTGKSTLLNAMTGADVFVKNALFATLDPTARAFEIEGVPFLMVDTVGFLQSLPHNLIEAFKSTLESALNCDLALIVCDAAGEYELQMKTTLDTLKELGFDSPYLIVMNKCDIAGGVRIPKDAVAISAKGGTGLETLKTRIFEAMQNEFVRATLFVHYRDMAEYGAIRNLLTEQNVTYTDDGARITAIIPTIYREKFVRFQHTRLS
ncbi:MAG: GTPase HflX [Clostridia bacterium]|nr:GTPase HflX [Clostridia bacterium]